MNDDMDKPLNTVGDDALEARITAWVLGEASSFEAGELEKRCAADPASRLFERRLRVLHGLVAEDFKAGPAAEWKLAAERRAKITDLLGVEPEVEEVLPRRKSHRGSSVRGLILALAACVVIGVASYSLLGGVGSSAKHAVMKESAAPASRRVDEQKYREQALAQLDRAVAQQKEIVEDKRKLLAQVIRQEGVIYRGDASAARGYDSSDAAESKEQASRPKTRVDTTVDDAINQGIANRSFVDGKNDFETSQRLLETLQIKQISEKMQSKITEDRLVINDGPSAVPESPPPASMPVARAESAADLAPETQALAANKRQSTVKATPSRGHLSDHVTGYTVGGAGEGAVGGVAGPQAEATPGIALQGGNDFILPAEGATIPGVPAATSTTANSAFTAGNRSGDAAITRNNIDAILNNPDRVSGARQEGEGIAALTGTFNDAKGWTGSFSNGAVATDQKAKDELAGAKGRAGAVESEFRTRNPKGWLVAGNANEAGLGGGGGMPQEPQAGTFFNMNGTSDSRFKSDLRLGSERELGRGDASNFGDLDAMGRLAGEAKPQQDLDYFDSKSASQLVDGIADLSDLARKQRESGVDALNPGQVYGLTAPAGGATAMGGLKRDLSLEPVPAQAPAAPAPAATGDFDGFVNQGAPIQLEIADEPTKARFLFPTEAEPPSLLPTKDATDITAGVLKDLNKEASSGIAPSGDDARARILEEVDKAWELSVPPVDSLVWTDPAAPAEGKGDAKPSAADQDDPIRSNPALALENAGKIDEVRRKLYIAEGNHNLGKFEDAQKSYEDVLRVDPYNKAARRGMEKVAAAKSDYYRAAYDQTRAEPLVETDKGGSVTEGGRGFDESESVSPEFVIRTITDLENGRRQWREQIETLEKAQDGALMQHASGLVIPDNVLPVLVPQLQDARRRLDAMRSSGLAASHPSVAALSRNVESMDRDVKEAIENLKATLAVKLELADEQVNRLASTLEPATRESVMSRLVVPLVAKPVIVEPTAEIVTTDEPFSTFSLHVSDASFKLAHAAMERGEVPAAEGIRPEEFYNAFDYGDPAPASGEPVVCVTEQSAHPAFAQRNLLRIGVRTGSQGRGASTPLNLTLLLDHSGSMEREDRNAGLAMAVRQLSGLLKEGDTITVAGFSRQPRLLADRLPGARAQELNELIEQTPSEGGTNLEEGLKLGEELAKRQFDPAAQNRVVLFTDGAANLGDARPEALQARIEGLRQQEIAFDAAGFGADGLNDKLLERLTRNGNGRYYIVDGPEDADAGFAKQLAGAFRPAAENVKVQVRFNPARVAKYKLIGFEEHRLKKEDFRNDAVDAAEMAAEEAGNALYQIETLPQGEGEVGEVSVRFRDVASGRMVERTWTIPYDAQAPAFDRATPSIQLAGLAAFTAEKLRAAPMADAVDFQQLGQVYAGVRARYPNSQPVADLGSMIGKMK